jgi:hypothetical protein
VLSAYRLPSGRDSQLAMANGGRCLKGNE